MRFIFLILITLLHGKQLDLKVNARSAILMNADTGAILFEQEAHTAAFPASVTKVATALYILETQRLSLDQVVKASGEALKMRVIGKPTAPYWLISDGSMMWLKKGEELTVETLLHGLMLVSGNDAANVLAEAHSNSIPRFVEELNHYLRNEVGCTKTQFCNPHGVHDEQHFTSAFDLCLIAKRALLNPKFREIVAKTSYQCPASNKRASVELRQTNALIRKGKFNYPKAIGIKTGFHSNAVNTLIAAAEHEGRTLIAVLLGCEKSDDRFKNAISLFETAFQEKQETKTLMGSDRVFSRAFEGVKKPLLATLKNDLELSYYPSEEPECRAQIRWEAPSLPIRKGQKVGVVEILNREGRIIQIGELVAQEELKGTFFSTLKQKLFDS